MSRSRSLDELKKRLEALQLPEQPQEEFEPPVLPMDHPQSGIAPELERSGRGEEFGLRVEGEQWVPSRSPLTPFGWQALTSLRPQLFPGDRDVPAMLAAASRYQDRRFLLEAIASGQREWGEEEERLVQDILEQTALALEHAELFQRIQKALAETERLYRATTAINQATTYQEILNTLREFTILAQGARYISLSWFEPALTRTQRPEWIRTLAKWSAMPGLTPGLPERIPYTMMASGEEEPVWEPVVTVHRDVEHDPHVHPAVRQITLMLGGRSALWVPLFLGESMVGFLFAVYPEEQAFPEEEIRILQSLAIQASARISTLYLAEQTQKALAETEHLYRAAVAVSEAADYEALLHVLREYTVFRDEHLMYLGLILFDPPQTEERRPEYLRVPASWTTLPSLPFPESAPFTAYFGEDERPFQAGVVRAHEDAETDPSIHPKAKEVVLQMRGRAVIMAPLVAGREVLGFVMGVFTEPRAFADEEIRFLSTLVSHMGVRVQSLRLTDELRRLLNMTERLYQAAAALNQARTLQEVLDTLAQYTVLGRMSVGSLLILFEPTLKAEAAPSQASIATTHLRQARGEAHLHPLHLEAEEVTALRDLLLRLSLRPVSSLEGTPLGDYLHEFLQEAEASARNALLVPLWVGEDVIGLVVGLCEHLESLSEEEAQELLALQAQVAVRVDGLLHHQQAQALAEQLRTVAEIARDIGAALSVQELLDKAVDLIKERFGFYHVSVFLLDPEGLYAVVQASTGPVGEVMKRSGHRLAVGSASVVGQAAHQGQPVVVNDTERSSIHRPNPLLPETRAEVAIPLRIGDRVIGVLDVQATQKYAFTDTVVQVLQLMADQLAIAVESARAYDLSRRALEELRRADELKTQFLANMSHELRTPLNSIIGFSRIILKGIDGPITEQQRQDLEAIYNAGQHLLGLINDILDLSKIEAGKMELSFEEVDVAQILESVLATIRGLIKDKPIELRVDVQGPLPTIYADAKRVRQILLNVLSNAAKFTQEGYIKVVAQTQTTKTGGRELLVVVEDTGPGIPKEAQERLFTPFFQADAAITRAVGGTGLGLAITRHLVEMHGGRIWIESEEGKGTKVFITFPVGVPEQKEVAFALVFDDNRQVDLYRTHFGAKGYRVIGTLDPKEFQARLLSVHPFTVLINPFLPDRQGLQLLHQLQTTEETRQVPILLASLAEGRRLFLPPFTGFSVKPLEEGDFYTLMRWAQVTQQEPPYRFLLVDRDAAHTEQVQTLAKRMQDVELVPVPTYGEAFDHLRSETYHLAIVDLLAPGDMMAFLRLVERLSQEREAPFPIIGLLDPVLTPETWGLLDLLIRQWWRTFVYDLETGLSRMERYFYFFDLLRRTAHQEATA